MQADTDRLLRSYPRIFFACHARHVRDPETQKLVTAHQASILDHLDRDERITLAQLAAHMGVKPSTMSVAVEALVKKGLMSRRQSEEDRRKVLLSITPAGERVRSAQSVLEPERVNAMLAKLSPEAREAALKGLELLAEAADRYLAEKGPGWK